MKTVEVFTYLGSVIASNGKFTQDIERTRAGATRAFGMLRRRLWGRSEKSLKVKMKISNTVVLPLQCFTEERRLDAFEMGMLRSNAGVRRRDFIQNEEIKERLCQTPVS